MQPEVANRNRFELTRLLETVFAPQPGQKVAVLIDLPDPQRIKGLEYLGDADTEIQQRGFHHFYQPLKGPVGRQLDFAAVGMYAYRQTGASNLDLPDECFDINGRELSLERDVYPTYDIFLCVTQFSATAPLTVFAHRHNFRAATLHGLNETILESGLAVDYNDVDADTEKIRRGFVGARQVEIDFDVLGERHTLTVELANQEPRKSSGVCTNGEPDVVNLPSGEIYFMPTGAHGTFPMIYDDGTFALLNAADGRVTSGSLLSGNPETLEQHLERIARDPSYGTVGELGIGTQDLPFAGADIQDEKIIGTIHVATGRMDHLGEHGLGPADFKEAANASHDDVLFAPHKMPDVNVPEVRMVFDDVTRVIIENYEPSSYVKSLLP